QRAEALRRGLVVLPDPVHSSRAVDVLQPLIGIVVGHRQRRLQREGGGGQGTEHDSAKGQAQGRDHRLGLSCGGAVSYPTLAERADAGRLTPPRRSRARQAASSIDGDSVSANARTVVSGSA